MTGFGRAAFDFTNRSIVVTGGARGIGLEVAREFGLVGGTPILIDRNESDLATAMSALEVLGIKPDAHVLDVTDEDAVARGFQEIDAKWGIDVLVNSAGIAPSRTVIRTAASDWRRTLDVNLTGTFLCSQAALGFMSTRSAGSIVNIASVAAKRISYNSGAAYTASKAGVVAFTRQLAYEAAVSGVRVNAICPGPVETAMLAANASDEVNVARLRTIPAGRLTRTSDIAEAAMFLSSDAAAMVCGVALDVDGGALLGWYDLDTYFARREPVE